MAAQTGTPSAPILGLDLKEYRRRILAWTMYDWANSAFATTILAAVLPVYYSQVAGATLPSATRATTYWSIGLSLSLAIIAILSPILGTISDLVRMKKPLLAVFAGIGILATSLLVLVGTGDWLLASILFVIARIGFSGSTVFYDAMLPHVAKEEDIDKVSARGYATGYLGGGLLLAINVVMIQMLPGTWGPRFSFLSVGIWWAVFSIPLFLHIPEPPAAAALAAEGKNLLRASLVRLKDTLADVRRYRELFKYLISFLIYNDGIGTIIGVAAIYGAELGFGGVELVLALLLVQFVGIPYSLIFGRLPSPGEKRRAVYLAFVVFNLAALPLLGLLGARLLPADLIGSPPAPFASTDSAYGEGLYPANSTLVTVNGAWQDRVVPATVAGTESDGQYREASETGARLDFPYNGQKVRLIYSTGPDRGILAVEIDGRPALNPDGDPLVIDAYSPTVRYEASQTLNAEQAGAHVLTLVNTAGRNPQSSGSLISVGGLEVLPGVRQSNLGLIIGLVVLVEAICLGLAFLLGKALFSRLAEKMDTQRSIQLSLLVYAVIAVWGFFLNSVIEFWALAWMVAIVQGGSQALSRSLYTAMTPAAKSGEFFGLFSIMEKFSSILGPLLFAAAGTIFGSSRPAVLSLIVLFILGGTLLSRVNVAAGRQVAQEEDAALLH